jgi:hypothetical protein
MIEIIFSLVFMNILKSSPKTAAWQFSMQVLMLHIIFVFEKNTFIVMHFPILIIIHVRANKTYQRTLFRLINKSVARGYIFQFP